MATPAHIDTSKCDTDQDGDGLRTNRGADLTLCIVSPRPTPEHFEQLAMPLFDSLYNFAGWLTGSREEAEDLVQETYLKGLKGFGSFESGTNFRAWIFRILRNTFLTSRTGLQAMRTVPLENDEGFTQEPVVTETPESILLGRVSGDEMQAALSCLPVIFREVLLLCDVEEMSYQEIAETVAIPVGTVMSRLHRARRALREELHKPKGRP
jgi:RNA polymerase sigma-70 factor, ECF subfamily